MMLTCVGEHAVLYGSRAVALPLSGLRLQLVFLAQEDSSREFTVKMEGISEAGHSSVMAVVAEACELLDCLPCAFEIRGQSDLPLGAGFGSSAALCVAILRGLSQVKGLSIDDSDLAVLANKLETRFHGRPSGLDTAVISFESCIRFRKGCEADRIEVNHCVPWGFLLVDSGLKASTKSMIQIARPYFMGEAGEGRVEAFDKMASRAETGLRLGDHSIVAEAMNRAGEMLAEAGVVTDRLEAIMTKALELGCLAAKPTGAGGGGAVLLLLDPGMASEQKAAVVEAFGSDSVFDVGFGAF